MRISEYDSGTVYNNQIEVIIDDYQQTPLDFNLYRWIFFLDNFSPTILWLIGTFCFGV